MPETGKSRKTAKITINEAWCKKCGICVKFCPKGILAADDFGKPTVQQIEKCTRCMLCVVRCPDFALDVAAEDPEPEQPGAKQEE